MYLGKYPAFMIDSGVVFELYASSEAIIHKDLIEQSNLKEVVIFGKDDGV